MQDIEGIEEGSLEPALAVSTVAPFSAVANASAQVAPFAPNDSKRACLKKLIKIYCILY